MCSVSDHMYIVMDQNVFEYNENGVLYYAEWERERKKMTSLSSSFLCTVRNNGNFNKSS